ncbi:MAG TPA: hypothetical protein VFB78_12145 [Acidimicrobiales bacterium]|jgi:hypothetical protein|nr:hypothetical protein [Acidimicrobiales bacterium]
MYPEADSAGFDEATTAIASMHAVAEVEIASALEYAHARAAAVIAEAEAQAESIRAGAIVHTEVEPATAPPAPVLIPTASPITPRRDWPIPVEALVPMVALVLLLGLVLVWLG